MSNNNQAWMVWAGKLTQGFRRKVDAERMADCIKAIYPRAKVTTTKVNKP